MNKYPTLQTIRYMGNKTKLLSEIIPEIEALTNEGDIICDIMAGTNSIGYALKKRNVIYSNDIQEYSYVIAKTLLSNFPLKSESEAHLQLDANIKKNKTEKIFRFFEDNYSDTYFSLEQCIEIDSIRFAIEQSPAHDKEFYLTLLMSAMCKVQSSTGHFAQFLPKTNKRTEPLRKMSVVKELYSKFQDFSDFEFSTYQNKMYNLDYKDLFQLQEMKNVSCFYLDSPYTCDQYSRFYHILETICKYDNPQLSHKAKYRQDRPRSAFCYKKSVAQEFENVISFCRFVGASLVISYSDHGVISVEELLALSRKYYEKVRYKRVEFAHSTQGKGEIKIDEIVVILEA